MLRIVDETHEFLTNEGLPEEDVTNNKSKTRQNDQIQSSKLRCVILKNDERTTGKICNHTNTEIVKI